MPLFLYGERFQIGTGCQQNRGYQEVVLGAVHFDCRIVHQPRGRRDRVNGFSVDAAFLDQVVGWSAMAGIADVMMFDTSRIRFMHGSTIKAAGGNC